jgi:hypothetical protein
MLRAIYLVLVAVALTTTTRPQMQNSDLGTQKGDASPPKLSGCGDGVGILDEIGDKNELELIQRQIVKPMMKRVYQSWLEHMPAEAKPPTSAKGIVVVTFTLLSDGSVRDVLIATPSAIEPLNDAAQMAVLNSHHEITGRRPLDSPANPDLFPKEVHRSSLHMRVPFVYNIACL